MTAAAEGALQRPDPSRSALAFFAANRKVCEEWVARCRELLLRVAAAAGCHHHVVHHGMGRLAVLAAQAKGIQQQQAQQAQQAQQQAQQAQQAQQQQQEEESEEAGGRQRGRAGRTQGKNGRQVRPQGQDAQEAQEQEQPEPKLLLKKEVEGAADAAAALSSVEAVPGGPAEAGEAAGGLEASAAILRSLLQLLRHLSGSLAQLCASDVIGGLYSWCRVRFAAVLPASGSFAVPEAGTQQDTLSWLEGVRLQAAGSHAAAVKAYCSWLQWNRQAQAQAGSESGTAPGGAGSTTAAAAAAVAAESEALEHFLLERMTECSAALQDWQGLQALQEQLSARVTAASSDAAKQWWASAQEQALRFFAFAPAAELQAAAAGLDQSQQQAKGAVDLAIQSAMAAAAAAPGLQQAAVQQRVTEALAGLQGCCAELQQALRPAAQLHLPHHADLLSDIAAVQWLHQHLQALAGPAGSTGGAAVAEPAGLPGSQQGPGALLLWGAPVAADWLLQAASTGLTPASAVVGRQAALLHGAALTWDLQQQPGASIHTQHLSKLLAVASATDPHARLSSTAALRLQVAQAAYAAGDTQQAVQQLELLAGPGPASSPQQVLVRAATLCLQLGGSQPSLSAASAAQQLHTLLQPLTQRLLQPGGSATPGPITDCDVSSASCLAEAYLALAHATSAAQQQVEGGDLLDAGPAADWPHLHQASLAACLAKVQAPSLQAAAGLLGPEALAPAACCQLALASLPGYSRAWQQLGDLLFRVTQVRRGVCLPCHAQGTSSTLLPALDTVSLLPSHIPQSQAQASRCRCRWSRCCAEAAAGMVPDYDGLCAAVLLCCRS